MSAGSFHGSTNWKTANKDHICKFCRGTIQKGKDYKQRTHWLRNGKKSTDRLHLGCIEPHEKHLYRYWKTHPKVRKPATRLVGRLYYLNDEQKRRRGQLQYYLTRDKESLVDAYQSKNTEKVHQIMARMASRLEEMQQTGVLGNAQIKPQESDLIELLEQYDAYWWDEYKDASKERQIYFLHRENLEWPKVISWTGKWEVDDGSERRPKVPEIFEGSK